MGFIYSEKKDLKSAENIYKRWLHTVLKVQNLT
jgi:hypothetical protein